MKRRQFLKLSLPTAAVAPLGTRGLGWLQAQPLKAWPGALAAIASGGLLGGCSGPAQDRLTVQLLLGSVPAPMLNRFKQFVRSTHAGVDLRFSAEPQLQNLFELLQRWKQRDLKPTEPSWQENLPLIGDRGRSRLPDLITLGDGWLEKAIQQNLIQPFEPAQLAAAQLSGWSQLPPAWLQWLTRNSEGLPDPQGKIWAVPYRIGTQVLIYRQDLLRQQGIRPPQDWADLWRPEFRDRFSLPNQAREVIGLTLKRLGQSYNTPELSRVSDLESQLKALHQQAKLYSSTSYLQPLMLGDTWLAVGNSYDALTAMQRNPNLAAVVPQSGTALWADLWVQPRNATWSQAGPSQTGTAAIALEWLRFCWQPEIAQQLSLISRAAAPVTLLASTPAAAQDPTTQAILFPPRPILERSELLSPLPAKAIADYQALWQKITA